MEKTIVNSFINKDEIKIKDSPNYIKKSIEEAINMVNFGDDSTTMNHIGRTINFCVLNSSNIYQFETNIQVIKKIQHFHLVDFVNKVLSDDTIYKLINNNDLILVKNADSPYGSNNRILKKLSTHNPMLANKIISHTDLTQEHKLRIYIDDFVGTGTTATELLNFRNCGENRNIILCNFIVKDTYERLIKEQYKVFMFEFTNHLTTYEIDYFETITTDKDVKYHNKEYCLQTLISENYNPPNNNTRFLYYSNNHWNPFLNRRLSKRDKVKNIKYKEENKFKTNIFNDICEGQGVRFFNSKGINTTKKREEYFNQTYEEIYFDKIKNEFVIESNNDVKIYITKGINLIINQFK